MMSLGLLLLLVVVGGFVLGIVGFFMALGQSERDSRTEFRLRQLELKSRELMDEIDRLRGAVNGTLAAAPPEPSDVPPAAVTPAPEWTTFEPEAAKASLEDDVPPAAEPPSAAAAAEAPARHVGLEERLGTRWAVWVGGVALALGALLLVRYSIEQGLFGPGMRVALGAGLAALLVTAGEWLRRNETGIGLAAVPSAHIPGVLTAAGTVAAFATIYAAHALYGFIGAGAAFALLGAVGLAAMLAARLHGPALAGLGLAGSLATPLLVSSEAPNPWSVVLFLAVVSAAAYVLARAREWTWLAAAAAGGGIAWGLLFATEAAGRTSWIAPAMLHALVGLGLAVVAFGGFGRQIGPAGPSVPDRTGTASLAGFALLGIAVLVANAGVSPAGITFAALIIALLAAAGSRAHWLAGAMVIAGLFVLGAIFVWPSLIGSRAVVIPGVDADQRLFSLPQAPLAFIAFAALAATAVAVLAGLRLHASTSLEPWSAGVHATTAALTPLLALVLVYARIANFNTSIVFALAAGALAAAYAVATAAFQLAEGRRADVALRLGTGAMAVACLAAAALALAFWLDRGVLTIALALAALAAAVIGRAKAIPALRLAVAGLGLVVLGRLVWDPSIMGGDVGSTPLFNWLLVGYGIPAAAFYAAARVLEDGGEDSAYRLSDALAIVFAAMLAFFEIRHGVNDGDIYAVSTGHVEQGLLVLTALGFAHALMRSGLTRGNKVFEVASLAFGVLSSAGGVMALAAFENPYFTDEPVRSLGPISSLWLAYLLPGLAAAVLSRTARGAWPRLLMLAVAGLALLLVFGFVSLSVRHLFHGERIGFLRDTSEAEFWTYSAAWLMLGLALLAYGLWRAIPEARLASAGLVVLTVLKVFLWDMSDLEGVLRALSFIGLGAVLLGIGLVYQRLVFADRAANQL